MRKNKWLLAIGCACIALGAAVGCDQGTTVELNLVQESVELELFEEYDLDYTATEGATLTWSVADSSIVTVENGKLVALKEGETTVTLQSGEVSDVCTIKVNALNTALLNVSAGQSQVSLYAGETCTLTPAVTYGTKTMEEVSFSYESSADTLVSVSNEGVVTANAVGQASIFVTATVFDKSVGCIVNVTVEKNGKITLDAMQSELYALAEYEGKTYQNAVQLQATVTERGVQKNDATVVWTSSDESVATVENGNVVAVALGDAQITATYVGEDGNSVEAFSFITVIPVTHTVKTTTDIVKTSLFPLDELQTDEIRAYITDGILLDIPVPVLGTSLDFSGVDVVGETTLVLETGNVLFNMPIYVWTDEISDVAGFTALLKATKGHYRLVTDLDFTGVTWKYGTPVVFEGVLDGRNHTLKNFAPTGCGIFYELSGDSTVQNLKLENATLTSANKAIGCIAAIISNKANVTVENVTGNILNNGVDCGGLFGRVGTNVKLTLARNNLHIYAENTATTSGALVGCADSEVIMSSDAPSTIYANIDLCGTTAYSGYKNSASTAINQNTYEKPKTYQEILDRWNENELPGTKIAISETNVVKATFFGKTIEELAFDNGIVLPAAQVEGFEGNNYEIMLEKADGTIAYYAVKIEYGELKLTNANKHLLKEANNGTKIALQEDIDLGGETWSNQGHFVGTLDGKGHVIKNFTLPNKDNWGFFVTAVGTIKNIGFVGVKLEKGASVICARNGSGALTLENVFIEVVEFADPTSTNGIMYRVRKNEASTVTMTNVVASMPSNKAKVFGALAQYETKLTNVYTIGIPSSAPYAVDVQKEPTVTACGHYADLAAFNGATKTLTAFLTSCVENYLNK